MFSKYQVKNLKLIFVTEKRMTGLARYKYETEKVFVSKRKVICVKEKRYFGERAKDGQGWQDICIWHPDRPVQP